MTSRAEEQHQQFLATPPSEDQLAAVVKEVAPGASVTAVVPLTGGIASAVHRVDLGAGASTTSIVVRRFNEQLPWHSAARVAREASLLAFLEPTRVPAPLVLLSDPDGSITGCSMLVLSLLPGRSIDPPGDDAWASELATALAGVHDVDAPFDAEPWLTFWADREALPEELARHELSAPIWEAVVGVRGELAGGRRALAHHDFHPGNTLWSDGRVTGIVDWPLGGRGYVEYDAVYCAFDITLSKGAEAGDRFLRAYTSVTGMVPHDGWRVVVATRALDELDDWLNAYLGVGTRLTLDELRGNFRSWVDDALRRVR